MAKKLVRAMVEAGFSLKGLKCWDGHEGPGYQFTLLFNKQNVAQVTEDGNGGMVRIDWAINVGKETTKVLQARMMITAAKAKLEEIIKTAEPLTDYGDDLLREPLPVDEGVVMSAFVDNHENKKICKKATLFRCPGDPSGSYREVNVRYDADVKAQLLRRYPSAVFLNEEVV